MDTKEKKETQKVWKITKIDKQVYNFLVLESKDSKLIKMLERDFGNLIF